MYLKLIILFVATLLLATPLFPQVQINGDKYLYLNWEESNSLQLEASVSKKNTKVKWSCPQNQEVKFQNSASLKTNVTFPRPGYYLLTLSAEINKKKVEDSIIVNLYQPGSFQERASDLVKLMTLDEKLTQLTNLADSVPRLGLKRYNYWSEALHGVLDIGVTSFPQAIALGATWDPDLVFRVATAISDEARIKNITEGKGLSYWSPTINIARDPRWGRNEESYSEDPYLLSQMGVAFVKGMQGDHPYYLKTVSTPKHFIANNEESRRHTGSSDVDMRNLQEYYLPAFKAAITEGKAFSIMGAYNELNHVPANANSYLLTDLLRREWGFDGYVVSDCGAINDMVNGHHFFDNPAEAVARSILAGCDLNCGEYYRLYLKEALDSKLLDERDVDIALERVLTARFKLGEFDPPEIVPYNKIPLEKIDSEDHRKLALEAAHKAIVLLKNEGILPINKEEVKSIAVIGPNADELQLGIYSGGPKVRISPLQGIKEKAEKFGITVNYTTGSDIGGGLQRAIEPKYFGKIDGIQGVKGEYFDNMNLEGEPVLTRIDSMINFSFGGDSPAPGVPHDKFSIRWTGKIIPTETIYSIGTRTDDGARFYLNGKLLFEDWTEHGEKPNNVKMELEAGKEYDFVFEYYDNSLGASARLTWDLGQKDFETAKEVASQNDLVILVLGITPGISEEELDRNSIELPEVQRLLIEEVASVNDNIVAVLINGGPLALAGSEDYAEAIVESWYAGQSTGTALADVLFGDANPGGKLPQTFYASTEQLPPMSDYDIINHERTYMYFTEPVLFPFGHGLSYTEFEYSDLTLSSDRIKNDQEIQIKFTLKNTGELKGDEVVQVYSHDVKASVKVPIRKLKRFQRITLEPGEEKTLTFNIPASEFSFYDIESNKFIVEPGEFEIQVGSSSEDIRLTEKFVIE